MRELRSQAEHSEADHESDPNVSAPLTSNFTFASVRPRNPHETSSEWSGIAYTDASRLLQSPSSPSVAIIDRAGQIRTAFRHISRLFYATTRTHSSVRLLLRRSQRAGSRTTTPSHRALRAQNREKRKSPCTSCRLPLVSCPVPSLQRHCAHHNCPIEAPDPSTQGLMAS